MTSEQLAQILAKLDRCQIRGSTARFTDFDLPPAADLPGIPAIRIEKRMLEQFRRSYGILEAFASMVCGVGAGVLTEEHIFLYTLGEFEAVRKAELEMEGEP